MGENRDSERLQEIAKSLAHIEQLLQDMPERLLERVPDMYLAYATAEAKMPKLSVLMSTANGKGTFCFKIELV